MSIISNIRYKAIDYVLRGVVNRLNEAVWKYHVYDGQVNYMQDNPASYILDGYAGNAGLYAIINRVDMMSRQAKLVLKRKQQGEDAVVENHELSRFLERVNKDMTLQMFISSYIINRMSTGNHYTYRLRYETGSDSGKVAELYSMPVTATKIVTGTWMDPVKGYRIDGTINQDFTTDEIVHFKLVNPLWGDERSMYGMSPLRAASKILAKQNQSDDTELKQFENQGPPYIVYKKNNGTIPVAGSRWTPEQKEKKEKEIEEAGKGKRRGLPLLSNEELGIINIGNSIADMKIVESSKEGRKVLCSVFCIPPPIVGIEDPTYNNLNTARKSAWTDCICPTLDDFASHYTQCLINGTPYEKDGLYFDFDYSAVEELQDGYKTQVEWMRQAFWTPNEIRLATGKNTEDNPVMDAPIFKKTDTTAEQVNTPTT